jgi:hypothetical protein
MSSSSKAVSINEHFERPVQKLDALPIPFYPIKSTKTAEGKGKIETKKFDFPYDHTDCKNTKTYEITRMVFEDGNPEEVCEFCLGLKELFEYAGITGNQLVTMTLSLLTGKVRACFQNINREKTAKNADLDHMLNELELFNIVLDDWVETFFPQHTSNESSSDYFAKQKNASCIIAKCHLT